MPGGFGYRTELEFAGSATEVMDTYLTYSDGGLTITAGQHNNFQGLEEISSSLFTSFIERAAFTDAFGFERRIGLSAAYAAGDVLLQGGAFTDNIHDVATTRAWGLDGRAVYMPKLGSTQLHLGGSVHMNDLPSTGTLRYRQRPLVHFTTERFIDTGTFSARRELGIGLEGAVISGRFHAAAETYWQSVDRPGALADPDFFGAYVEAGYFLTEGDTRGYRGGVFNRDRPARGVDAGGTGAIQINLRYDYLDLADAGIAGGVQNGYHASLIWTPTSYTRLMLNYARSDYAGAIHPATGGDRDYAVDAIGVRAQIDF
jgi:phosphate-selective porin OprO/OprP